MDNHMVHSALQFAREMEEEEKRKQEELRKENERKRLELKKIAAQEETICLLKQQLVEANKAQDEARQEAMKSKKQSYISFIISVTIAVASLAVSIIALFR